jgi:hypothetical protein
MSAFILSHFDSPFLRPSVNPADVLKIRHR